MNRLQGKTAVVTGGNSGIGLATARLFAEEGARVVIAGRNKSTLQEAAESIGHGTVGVAMDVSKLADIDRLYQSVADQFGRIDVLVANAGIFKGVPLADFTEELYDELVDVNLKGTFFTVQKALPYLNDGASVILVSSSGVPIGMNSGSVYLATKAASLSLARDFSVELLNRSIRVNVLTPGPIETPIFGRLGMAQEMVDGMKAGMAQTTQVKRLGTAEEMAKGMLYLASDDSSFMIGNELVLDGGMGFKAI